jgi:hypothetical protein
MQSTPHTFHIPVMGTGFTLDTPLRVARYGITSVISLVDDMIIEQARKFHCEQNRLEYQAITTDQPDFRAHRITAYLNLVNLLVEEQVTHLKASPFEPGSEISRYYELLPPSPLREAYLRLGTLTDADEKRRLEQDLRSKVVAGGIDVNIMTKLNADRYHNGVRLPDEYADGMSALRGYALSDVSSAIVFSAGINQRLYTYAAQFDDFYPVAEKPAKKRIILKVSDYRSALIQGKFLAKRGLWVSEFRIESGLNCGGHAFTAECNLLGPVLEQFKRNRGELVECLHKIYSKALVELGRSMEVRPESVRITVQGGIGTSEENNFLFNYYNMDGTGWGTPFMVVPEVTNVDPEHLEKLCNARHEDIFLSNASPLGIPFWNLRTSASEEKRRQRIDAGKPGSPCKKGFTCLNTEFTEKPICVSSREYISRKLAHLAEEGLADEKAALVRQELLDKACICHDLGGAITIKQNGSRNVTPAVCCGPNIRNFNRTFSLEEMVNHIYGRLCVIVNKERQHMFLEEMRLNQEYLREEIKKFTQSFSTRPYAFFESFKKTLLEGIDYYQDLTKQFIEEKREKFIAELEKLQEEIERTCLPGKCSEN